MADIYKPLKPGDLAISAAAWNEFLEMLVWWKTTQQGGSGRGSSTSNRDSSILLVKNDSGDDIERFGILGLDTFIVRPTDNLDAFKSRPVVSGLKPRNANHRCRFGVLLDSIPSGSIGRCVVDGVVPVKVEVTDDTKDTRAVDIKDNETTMLTMCGGGYRVLDIESGTGTKWAYVHLGNKEGNLYAQMDPSESGQHPISTLKKYRLIENGVVTTKWVKVNNKLKAITVDIRSRTVIISGVDGEYGLVSVDPCA